ncbi:MAG TPA: DUF4139 domain-containing protein [Candidatus Micrarchaeota archaeon]|nr:DUF4139 domain-containing protein [Candidatus Micrarchaeota archaeon]
MASVLLLAALALLQVAYPVSNLTVPLTSVSLYSNGYGFFERAISTNLPTGQQDLQVMNFTQSAISDSISISDSAADILSYRFFSRLVNTTESKKRLASTFELLNSSIGSTVALSTSAGTISGTLVWASPDSVGLQTSTGVSIVRLGTVNEMSLSPGAYQVDDNTTTQSTEHGLAFSEQSKAPNHNIGISYLASSSWSAHYRIYLSPDSASGKTDLQAWSTINNNAGEDWKGVSMSVIVGSPKMASGYMPSYGSYDYFANNKALSGAAAAPSVSSGYLVELISGQYKYTLDGPVTLASGDSATYPLFTKSLDYQREYLWDTNRGSQAEKALRVKNDQDSPLASGVYRIYDGGVFAGEDSVQYTGRGAEAEIFYAYMPELQVKKDTATSTVQNGNARVTTYNVTLFADNKGETPVSLKIRDYMDYGDKVEFVSGSPTPTIANNLLTWRVDVPSGTNTTVSYTYTVTNYMTPPIKY